MFFLDKVSWKIQNQMWSSSTEDPVLCGINWLELRTWRASVISLIAKC